MTKSSVLPTTSGATKRVTTHPGAYLKADFLEPLAISATALAAEIKVPANRLTEMVSGTPQHDGRHCPEVGRALRYIARVLDEPSVVA